MKPLLAGAVAMTAALFLAPSTAAAFDSKVRRGSSSAEDHSPYKVSTAECEPGELVVGGGGLIDDGNRRLVRLVGLIPSPTRDGQLRAFQAIAEAPDSSSSYSWSVTAYAVCADAYSLRRHHVRHQRIEVPAGGGPFAHTAARCPHGTIAYGAGSLISAWGPVRPGTMAGGEIGLQLNRTSGPQDISRSAAREKEGGSSSPWGLTSYAICAEPPEDVHTYDQLAPYAEATAWCPSGWDVIGPGGGGGLTDGGPVWLQGIVPMDTDQGEGVTVTMTGGLSQVPETIAVPSRQRTGIGPPLRSTGKMVAYVSCAG